MNHLHVVLQLSESKVVAKNQDGFAVALDMMQVADVDKALEFVRDKLVHLLFVRDLYQVSAGKIIVHDVVNIFVLGQVQESLQ